MCDLGITAMLPEDATDLDHTAGVCRHDHLCAGSESVCDLTFPKTRCHLRLGNIVNACRATAETGLIHLNQLQSRHRSEKCTRLLRDALRVTEVTRLLIRNSERHLAHIRDVQRLLCEPFRGVVHLERERLRPLRVFRIVLHQV